MIATCIPLMAWRVVGWDARFEDRGSLRRRGPRRKISVSTDREGDELGRLLAVRGGFLAFGVWNLVVRLAATCSRRGVLIQDGLPMPVEELGRLAQLPVGVIRTALELLASPEIGLMECVPLHEATVPAEMLEPLHRKPKIKPLLECPFCAADLTEYYQLETPQGEPTKVSAPAEPTGINGSLNQCERSESEAIVPTTAASPMISDSLRSHRFAEPVPTGVRILTNSATVESPADGGGAVAKPRPTWLKPVMLEPTTREEIEDVHYRLQCGEMTRADVAHFIDTHYYEDDEDEDDEEWDWDWDEDDWEEFLMDIPPPDRYERGKW